MNVVLKWRNKYSNDEGFVKNVLSSKGHFVNTFDINEAKVYKGDKALNKDLQTLESIGETENNDFHIINLG